MYYITEWFVTFESHASNECVHELFQPILSCELAEANGRGSLELWDLHFSTFQLEMKSAIRF